MANLKITLVKSTNKAQKKPKATVAALGLKKIGQTVERPTTTLSAEWLRPLRTT